MPGLATLKLEATAMRKWLGFLCIGVGLAGALDLPPELEAIFRQRNAGGPGQDAPPLANFSVKATPVQGQGKQLVPLFDQKFSDFEDASFSGNGHWLVVLHKQLQFLEIGGKRNRSWPIKYAKSLNPGPGGSVAFDTDRPTLASYAESPKALTREEEYTICTGANGQLLLTDRSHLYDVQGRRKVQALNGRYLSGHTGAMSGDGRTVAFFKNDHASTFGHDHGYTSVVEVARNRELMGFDNGSYEYAVAVDEHANWVAEGRGDADSVTNEEGEVIDDGTKGEGGVFLFQRKGSNFRPAARWFPEQSPNSLAFCQSRPWLAVALGKRVCLWTVPEGKMVAQFDAGDDVSRIAVSPGLTVLVCTASGRVTLLDASRLTPP